MIRLRGYQSADRQLRRIRGCAECPRATDVGLVFRPVAKIELGQERCMACLSQATRSAPDCTFQTSCADLERRDWD
jgi:hypothetical protein